MNSKLVFNYKHCQYYYGANQIVYALHPYGPDERSFTDEPANQGLP